MNVNNNTQSYAAYGSTMPPGGPGKGGGVDFEYNNWLAQNGTVDSPANQAAYQAQQQKPQTGPSDTPTPTPAPAGGFNWTSWNPNAQQPANQSSTSTAGPAATTPEPANGGPPKAPTGAPVGNPALPQPNEKRPPGDVRTAQEIIQQTPVLKDLGNNHNVRDKLKSQVGDFENDPDAAFRAAKVLSYIDGMQTKDGGDRAGKGMNNGVINGFVKSGAREGTEAGVLMNFVNGGYDTLPKDGKLPGSKDPMVLPQGQTAEEEPGAFK